MQYSSVLRHAASVCENPQASFSYPQKVSLLKQYIRELELHIVYLQKRIDQYKQQKFMKNVGDILDLSEKESLIKENHLLSGECIIREQELLLVIQDNRFLQQKLKSSNGDQKNKTIQMLVEMNKKLQEQNLKNLKHVLQCGKLQSVVKDLRKQIQNLQKGCSQLKEELYEKRHVYSKFKLCLRQLHSLEVKYKKYEPGYKSQASRHTLINSRNQIQ